MANIDHKPSRYMLNLLHALSAFADEEKGVVNTIVEINPGTINKYEIITESGQLKLDRVGESSLSFPFAYGAIPKTWDSDGDPLDICIANVTESLAPGCLAEARVVGMMKFEDGGEVDDKIVAVLADDRRNDHISSLDDLGKHFQREVIHFWEYYKHLKKPGSGVAKGFFGREEAMKVIRECEERYNKEYAPKFVD